jgi:hypothetical protein
MFLEQVIYQSNAKDALISVPINGVVFVVLTLSVFFIALIFIITKPPSEE